jgi:hypothetical protein
VLTGKTQTPWGPIGYITTKRTYARRLRENASSPTEEFEQIIDRQIKAFRTQLKVGFTEAEEQEVKSIFMSLKGLPAGRFLWQLGTSTVDKLGLFSLQNCAAVVVNEPIRPFTWTMDALMLGSGVGYNIQRENVYQLPKVKKVKITRLDTKDADFIVPDSREGWIKLLGKVLKAHFFNGKGFTYSTVCVRGKGTQIKGFGGVASGPEELCWGMEQISKVLNARAGKRIRPIDALDIMNIIGYVVVSGNVRRSAQIAIGDMDDSQFLNAKRWDLENIPNWRAMSNNSVVCNDLNALPEQFWDGYQGNGEPYGLINVRLTQEIGRRGETQYPDPEVIGFNPCQPAFATVLTPDGIRQFKDIDVGSTIWSGKNWTTVTAKWSTGVKSVHQYSTRAGRFVGTEKHKVFQNGERVEATWAEAIDTAVCDGARLAALLDKQDVLDGLVFGDGYRHKASNDLPLLCIGDKDQDYFESEVKDLIGRHRPGISEKSYEVQTTLSSSLAKRTYERRIPRRFYEGDARKVQGFLRGLFSANGSMAGERVTLKATSLAVIEQVQEMLSFLGIRSYYTVNKPSTIKWSNGTYTSKESYDLNITGDRSRYRSLIGFLQIYKQTRLDEVCDRERKVNKAPKSTYDVMDVSYLGEHEVFDITVEDPAHSYWTGGLLVSNCGEQGLANYETCCLSEIVLPNVASKEELLKIAIYLYRINKHSLRLGCHAPETEAIVHKNMRMGIGITGYLQASEEQRSWLSETYEALREYDAAYSAERGWPVSIKLTTTKPSGTMSLLPGVTPGVHPGFSMFFIRRVRMAANSELVALCKKNGYPVEFQKNFDGTDDKNTVVVSFPCRYPAGTVVAKDVTAIDQLRWVQRLQAEWSDNAVSCTVYYRKEELPAIREWLKENYNDSLKTVSFLLYQDHGFVQAPYEEITEEQYNEMVSKVTPIHSVEVAESDILGSDECSSGACPIK